MDLINFNDCKMKVQELNKSEFSILLKNKTDEKLSDVSLLNYDYKDQSKIEYKSWRTNYSHLLRQLSVLRNSDSLKITEIFFQANCDFERFAIKQVGCNLLVSYTYFDGKKITRKYNLIDFYSFDQVHKNMVKISFDEPMSLTGLLDLELDFLMPETEINATIFFTKPIIQE